jgi:hypothetical protein
VEGNHPPDRAPGEFVLDIGVTASADCGELGELAGLIEMQLSKDGLLGHSVKLVGSGADRFLRVSYLSALIGLPKTKDDFQFEEFGIDSGKLLEQVPDAI